jgi:hypothetical protein
MWETIAKAIGELFAIGLRLAEEKGEADAFMAAVDAKLVTSRAAVDVALAHKHREARQDEPTGKLGPR